MVHEPGYDYLTAVTAPIDRLCDQFERRLQSGEPSPIEDYLGQVSTADRSRLLQELLLLEWDYCISNRKELSIETYQRRFATEREVVDKSYSLFLEPTPASGVESKLMEYPGNIEASDGVDARANRVSSKATLDAESSSDHEPAPDISSSLSGSSARPLNLEKPNELHATDDASGQPPNTGILGDYVLFEEIGAGGMGHVYRARHSRMNRIVAVKVMSDSARRSRSAVPRFRRETEAVAHLAHPNIVQAYDAGQVGDVLYLVMEFVEGTDLSSLVKAQGPLQVEQALDIVRQAAQGLGYAHSRGIIHRDIKPSNLIRDLDGVIKVLDLGLARFVTDDDGLTSAEQIMGTVDYMSPEQATESKTADGRSDIYSLGCTFWYLLTGKRPYDGDTGMSRTLAHREAPLPSLSATRNDCLPMVETLLHKMIAKKPADRFATMADVIAAVDEATNWIRESAVANRSNPSKLKLQRRVVAVSRRPWFTAALVASLCVVLAIIAAYRLLPARPITPLIGSKVVAEATNVAPALVPSRSIKLAADAPPPASAPFGANEAHRHQEAWAHYLDTEIETTNSLGMRLTLIPPGEYLMGSTDEQLSEALKLLPMTSQTGVAKLDLTQLRLANSPRHNEVISRPFRIGTTEVTIAQFSKFIRATGYVTDAEKPIRGRPPLTTTWRDPGYETTDDLPATFISGNDASAFCFWLQSQDNVIYRLPTEAEWEFACRAGTITHYSSGRDFASLSNYSWNPDNTPDKRPQTVASKLANPFGLYDMHGSVAEWCRTPHEHSKDVAWPTDEKTRLRHEQNILSVAAFSRGGAWNGTLMPLLSSHRGSSGVNYCSNGLGFRVVQELVLDEVATTVSARPITSSSASQALSKATDAEPTLATALSIEFPADAPRPAIAPFGALDARRYQETWAQYLCTQIETTNSLGMLFKLIPPGEFFMGSTDQQIAALIAAIPQSREPELAFIKFHLQHEQPRHRVLLTKPFSMGAMEVTVGQFRTFVEATKYVTISEKPDHNGKTPRANWRQPQYPLQDNFPVTHICNADAIEFCRWLSSQEGITSRLPSEAEWEYACRAGTTSHFFSGDDEKSLNAYAWCQPHAPGQVFPVGKKTPNSFGLYDMLGNASEACRDYFTEKYPDSAVQDPQGPDFGASFVNRGGSTDVYWNVRSARRIASVPNNARSSGGFRIVRELDDRLLRKLRN
jgi:formylglycine-generating enzyme required for sulfatase activity/serine/threonine protein kinase